MLSDLRRYITDSVKIDEYSVAWYFKEFMERCKDNELVNTLMDNISENGYIIRDNEINPFEFLIADYHMTDVFAIDNVIIKLILSCMTTQFMITGKACLNHFSDIQKEEEGYRDIPMKSYLQIIYKKTGMI